MPQDNYTAATYGAFDIGWGERPAVVVVDFQTGFTDGKSALAQSDHVQRAVDKTSELLTSARAHNVPVASCRVGWGSNKDIGYWKIKDLYTQDWTFGGEATNMDNRVYDPDYDFNFYKSAPSIFFGTPLMAFLTKQNVDTVLVTGCTTSGCVRASIIDAFSYGYRVMVPQDCCGDQAEGPHEANLQDVGKRYADIITAADAIKHFEENADSWPQNH